MNRCPQCAEPFLTVDSRKRFCSLSCAAKFRGLGRYERPTIEKVCVECANSYTLRREGSDLCKKCRKRAYDQLYVQRKKPWTRVDPEKKRAQDAAYYKRHKEKHNRGMKRWYEENKTKVLAVAEKRRRARGERPKSSTMSGPERVFADLLEAAGIPYEFRSQIDGVEFDFIIHDHLAVELHGPHHRAPIWGDEQYQQTKETDARRREIANSRSIDLFEIAVITVRHGADKTKTMKNLEEALAFVRVHPDKSPEACRIP